MLNASGWSFSIEVERGPWAPLSVAIQYSVCDAWLIQRRQLHHYIALESTDILS
jgi:hypothetical protein